MGMGCYRFINSYRNSKDLRCVEFFKEALLENSKDYVQDIMYFIGYSYETKILNNLTALQWYEQIQDMNPNYPNSQFAIARVQHKLNQLTKAQKSYLKAEQLSPNNIRLLNSIAIFYKDIGKKVKTFEYLQKSYALNSNNLQTCYLYGKYFYENQQQLKGLKLLNDSILNQPEEQCEILLYLSDLQKKSVNYQNQLDLLLRCIQIQPNEGTYYYLAGNLLQQHGKLERATQYLEEALMLKIDKVTQYQVYFLLSDIYYKNQRFEESLECYFQAYGLSEQNKQPLKTKIISMLLFETEIPYGKKIEIIDSLQGEIQEKLFNICLQVLGDKKIYLVLDKKIQEINSILSLCSYKKHIQQFLQYQSKFTHWDIYLDL